MEKRKRMSLAERKDAHKKAREDRRAARLAKAQAREAALKAAEPAQKKDKAGK